MYIYTVQITEQGDAIYIHVLGAGSTNAVSTVQITQQGDAY